MKANIEQVFQAIFMNKEGRSAQSQGLDVDGNDDFFYSSPAVINVSCIESYYDTPFDYKGSNVLNVRMISGDEWSLLYTVSEMMALKKTSDLFCNN